MEDVGVGVVGFRDVGEVFGEFFFFWGGVGSGKERVWFFFGWP
jgi:hypothetical protein